MILKKLFKSFLDPLSLPHKVNFHSRKLFDKLFFEYRYKKDEFHSRQIEMFKLFEIDYEKSKQTLNDLRLKYSELKPSPNLPHSDHSTFFTGLSLKNEKIHKILEIGTFNGQNAFLLSILFTDAKIVTMDLPYKSKVFKKSYNRNEEKFRNEFLSQRNNRIKACSNLKLIEKSSVHLVEEKFFFDLVWIDGAHYDPIVSMDIINSLKILNSNGYILCDDVRRSNNNATWRTINILKSEKIIDFTLILKSLDPKYNARPSKRSYIAIIKKKFI